MAMLGLGREDWVISGLSVERCVGGVGARQQKTAPLRCGVLRFGACCLRARSSRTCWRGNKHEYENGRRAGVVGIRGGCVAMQHSCKLTPGFGPCQARGLDKCRRVLLPVKSLQP